MDKLQGLATADPDVVKRWTTHLAAAYEEFIDKELAAGRAPGFADGFMAAHNLHVTVVFHMEEEFGFDGEMSRDFRKVAVDTFVERMQKGRVSAPAIPSPE